ncbi:MAG: sugar transferase [Candidatus Treponema excrementipullorum]|uniref:Sugar transferase n=1 Tax=Candidatus Treponema excrementipullorum TaxID=2838768 RepID=A0A9E2L1B3_9SPIR|nr:sugar transferase [Candidatus Treponema excrementipullorum]
MIRFFDILFSGVAIIILLPFMIPIMIALKLTGEHYIFYQQERIGKGGKPFYILKFATMLKDSPNMPGGVLTQKNDPRILPMGKFLRKTKINELPQLVNIFIGQMSFIGPRPQAKQHYDLYSIEVKQAIDKIPPGLSGIGSLVFRDEEDMLSRISVDRNLFHDTVIAPYKGELEVWFSKNRNLKNYFKLIFMTVDAVLHPDSKKWRTAFKDLPPVPSELEQYI